MSHPKLYLVKKSPTILKLAAVGSTAAILLGFGAVVANQQANADTHLVSSVSELATEVANADDGDTVRVAAGTYELSSSLMINKSITLESEDGAAATTIKGNDIVVDATDVMIDGFTFNDAEKGVRSDRAKHAERLAVQNNVFKNGTNGVKLLGNEHISNLTIIDNEFTDLSGYSIIVRGAKDHQANGVTIKGNTATNTLSLALIYNAKNVTVTDNTATNNDLGVGLQALDGPIENVFLEGNTFTDNKYGVMIGGNGSSEDYIGIKLRANSIYDNSGGDIYNSQSSPDVDLDRNYWGSVKGLSAAQLNNNEASVSEGEGLSLPTVWYVSADLSATNIDDEDDEKNDDSSNVPTSDDTIPGVPNTGIVTVRG